MDYQGDGKIQFLKNLSIFFSVVTCGTAPNVAHATKVADGDMYSNTTTYTCVTGFKIDSNPPISDFSITCLPDGNWENIIHSCIGECTI